MACAAVFVSKRDIYESDDDVIVIAEVVGVIVDESDDDESDVVVVESDKSVIVNQEAVIVNQEAVVVNQEAVVTLEQKVVATLEQKVLATLEQKVLATLEQKVLATLDRNNLVVIKNGDSSFVKYEGCSPSDIFTTGIRHLNHSDYREAFQCFSILEMLENKFGLYWMGTMYQKGHGMPIDIEKAMSCYIRASQKDDGHSIAELELARVYRQKKDYANANKYFCLADLHGSANALDELIAMKAMSCYVHPSHKDEKRSVSELDLAREHRQNSDYANAEKYYFLADSHGSETALNELVDMRDFMRTFE